MSASLEELAECVITAADHLNASRTADRVPDGKPTGPPRGCSETDAYGAVPPSSREQVDKLGAPTETFWKETNWKKHFEQKFGSVTGNRQAPTPQRCAAPARHALGWLAKSALATCVAFAATAEYATAQDGRTRVWTSVMA